MKAPHREDEQPRDKPRRAPGLTVELDDEATEAQAQRIGRATADALMAYTVARAAH